MSEKAELPDENIDYQARAEELEKLLSQAQAMISEQSGRIADQSERMVNLDSLRDEARRGERAALEEVKLTRSQFGELKRLLHEAELQNARLLGYLDRVAEGDVPREEPRRIVTEHTERQSPPAAYRGAWGRPGAYEALGGVNHSTDGAARKHWTEF